jgi:ring-1,2-phenylacetyl-CoA epoxidase subunit PaaC
MTRAHVIGHVTSTAISPERIAARVSQGAVAPPEAVARYALALGDDALILAQRLGEWVANAPELEEDIALTNIGLDLLGHARVLLTYAGSAWGQTEDDLAYFRDEPQFRNRQLVELPRGDFAATIARQVVMSLYFRALYAALTASADATLAAIAAKAVKEVDYHVEHAAGWLLRLGLGTAESHQRMQAGLERAWPFVDELFTVDPWAQAANADAAARACGQVAVDPRLLRPDVVGALASLIADAGLVVPTTPALRGGGRDGIHTEFCGPLLAEMQVLARMHPGARW